MKVAVLGNGPSRFLFTNREHYDTIVGCNIPWTEVDYNVIIDESSVDFWYNIRSKYQYNLMTVFSEKAWSHVERIEAEYFFRPLVKSIMPIIEGADTSAHIAAKTLIEIGVDSIDLYGCDSRWKDCIDSRTHEYVNNKSPNKTNTIRSWNLQWDAIISSTNTKLNFIGSNESSTSL